MIRLSTTSEHAAATRAAAPPAAAPDSQPPVAPKPGGGGPTLNSQPLFPQAKGESGRAFEAFHAYLELASRLAAASGNTTGPAAAPGRSLEDQLTTLLDQACSEAGSQNDPAAQPASTSCAPKTL